MPSRRDKRQQEKEAFLQQNPQLIEFNTQIKVVIPETEEGPIQDCPSGTIMEAYHARTSQ